MHRKASAIVFATALLAATAFAAGCANDEEEAAPPTATAIAASPTLATTPVDAETVEPFEGGRDPVEVLGAKAPPVAVLTDVRFAAHEGFDRVVFEFSGSPPGYRVEYVDGAVGCGSGEPAPVAGTAFLQVHMVPAQAHDDAGAPTFSSQRLSPGLDAIVELVQTCDFEADVTWVAGLSAEADFRVQSLENPFRVVVDVAQP